MESDGDVPTDGYDTEAPLINRGRAALVPARRVSLFGAVAAVASLTLLVAWCANGSPFEARQRGTGLGRDGAQSALPAAPQTTAVQTRFAVNTGSLQRKSSAYGAYCYEDSPELDCWEKKPSADTPECNVDSGSTVCRCPEQVGSGCDVDALDSDKPATAWCALKNVYISGTGERHENSSNHDVDIVGKRDEMYCEKIVKIDEWHEKHLVIWETDENATSDDEYWNCGGIYTWEDGQCQRKERYLGETCWGGSVVNSAGSCVGHGNLHDDYSTSCYKGKCVPSSWTLEREQCQCDWTGWNFIVACSAAEEKCGGHACILNFADQNRYCDYSTAQNW